MTDFNINNIIYNLNNNTNNNNSTVNNFIGYSSPTYLFDTYETTKYFESLVHPDWDENSTFNLIHLVLSMATPDWDSIARILDRDKYDCENRYNNVISIFEIICNKVSYPYLETKENNPNEFGFYISNYGSPRGKRHRRTASEIDRSFSCDNCDRSYGSEGALKMHVKLKHPTQ